MPINMYVMQAHCVSTRWRSFSTFLHLKEIALQVSEPDDEALWAVQRNLEGKKCT
ncbi:hypothetical protein CFAL_07730 [Corynebacterium falsenii DSM 44353]|nr:hypothetical protein CFAL_07730 [Corynebacterium falsenii DSM 44353]